MTDKKELSVKDLIETLNAFPDDSKVMLSDEIHYSDIAGVTSETWQGELVAFIISEDSY